MSWIHSLCPHSHPSRTLLALGIARSIDIPRCTHPISEQPSPSPRASIRRVANVATESATFTKIVPGPRSRDPGSVQVRTTMFGYVRPIRGADRRGGHDRVSLEKPGSCIALENADVVPISAGGLGCEDSSLSPSRLDIGTRFVSSTSY